MRDGRDSEQSDKNSVVLREKYCVGWIITLWKLDPAWEWEVNELVDVLKGTKLRLLLLRAEIESKGWVR